MSGHGYVIGYQVADKLDLVSLATQLNQAILLKDHFELFLKVDEGSYIYAVHYGCVVFMNVDEKMRQEILLEIQQHTRQEKTYLHFEDLSIEISNDPDYKIFFNKLVLPYYADDSARIILINIAQSVALFRYMKLSEDLIEETRFHTSVLEKYGKLNIRGKSLLRFIGRTLNLKNVIAENLYIFDAPFSTWESQNLNRMNEDLARTFDLTKRHRSISENLNIVQENLDLFKDLVLHNQSTLLEWIIIVLILFEVVQIFIL